MKKFVVFLSFLLVFTMLFSVGCAEGAESSEILFRKIPWGTSATGFVEAMNEQQLGGSVYAQSNLYSWETRDNADHLDDALTRIEDAGFYYNYSPRDFVVAGVPVDRIYAYFLYTYDDENLYVDEEHSSLYKAEYYFEPADMAATYPILVEKLSSLYGKGTSMSGKTQYSEYSYNYEAVEWRSANDTGVRLFMQYKANLDGTAEYQKLKLVYGKTNSAQLFEELTSAIAREQTKTMLNSDDTDGL